MKFLDTIEKAAGILAEKESLSYNELPLYVKLKFVEKACEDLGTPYDSVVTTHFLERTA